jgi:hypothetical protein
MSVPRSLVVSISVSAVLAGLWGYSSAIYNWGNVGGRVGPDFEQWYAIGEVVPYPCLAAWAACIALSTYFAFARPRRAHFAWIFVAAASGPSVLVAALWFFQRGFPATAV